MEASDPVRGPQDPVAQWLGGSTESGGTTDTQNFFSGPWRGMKLDHGGNGGADRDELPNPRPPDSWASLCVANGQ